MSRDSRPTRRPSRESAAFDVIHVIEIGLDRANDPEILTAAHEQNRICITLDHDFHAHLALVGQVRASVVFLRTERVAAFAQADLIESICVKCGSALAQGGSGSAEGNSLRVRRLRYGDWPSLCQFLNGVFRPQ